MHKEKPANQASGPNHDLQTATDNLPQKRRGHKANFASADTFNPFKQLLSDIEAYLLEQGGVEECFTKRTSAGLLLGLDERRELLHPFSGDSQPIDLPAVLSPPMLQDYSFDYLSPVAPEIPIYEGFIAAADLGIWFGREKHRKSDVLLQFSISAALGRDFLHFKFLGKQPLRVVLIDFESKTSSLKYRIERIVAAMRLDEESVTLLWRNLRIIELRKVLRSGVAVPKFPVRSSRGSRMSSAEIQESAEFWEGVAEYYPADLYVIDPLRPLHSADENDSSIETLLAELRRVFRNAAVVVAHHMRKAHENGPTLVQDMRAFSDGGRGSTAIKAHADVIILQERSKDERGEEILYIGAFLKDGADIEPFTLMESDHESFHWCIVPSVPGGHEASFRVLKDAGGSFQTNSKAAQVLIESLGVGRATAFRHINTFLRIRLLIKRDGRLTLSDSTKSLPS